MPNYSCALVTCIQYCESVPTCSYRKSRRERHEHHTHIKPSHAWFIHSHTYRVICPLPRTRNLLDALLFVLSVLLAIPLVAMSPKRPGLDSIVAAVFHFDIKVAFRIKNLIMLCRKNLTGFYSFHTTLEASLCNNDNNLSQR